MRNPTAITTDRNDAPFAGPDEAWQAGMQPNPEGRPGLYLWAWAATEQLARIRLVESVIERELATTSTWAADLVARAVANRHGGDRLTDLMDRITDTELARWAAGELDQLDPATLLLRIGTVALAEPEGCPSCDGTILPPRHEAMCPGLAYAAAVSS